MPRIRFVVSGTNNNSVTAKMSPSTISPSRSRRCETLNGGLGDDTYSFGLGDGNDIINELSRNQGGAADRISILRRRPSIR